MISLLTGYPPFEWTGFATPSIYPILNFVLFTKNVNWDVMLEDFSTLFNTALPVKKDTQCLMQGNILNKIAGVKETLIQKTGNKFISDWNATIAFVQNLGRLMTEFRYVAHKLAGGDCKIKAAFPIMISFDIEFDLGFTKPTLKKLCSVFKDFTATGADSKKEEKRRRRLQALNLEYPIVPDIPLPCIPIAPPELMLCPKISVSTEFGLEIEPDIDIPNIGLKLTPQTSFDITASLALTLDIPILNAQVEMGVTVALVVIEFPVDIGINVEDAGVFGDISVDIKVLDLTIFLKFKFSANLYAYFITTY